MDNTNVWVYRETLRGDFDTTTNLIGYDVEASDGHIGKVDEASKETTRQYLVVDTGFWIFGKKRLVPAGVVNRIDHENRNVYLSMTKDQVKQAPDFEENRTSADEVYYDKFGSYYGEFGR